MNRGSLVRLSGYALIVLALLVTLRVNLITLAHIARARTSVPWADQWVVVQDVARRQAGEPLWPVVWTPYWGHRLVIPRLLFLADAHWFSLASLTWLTMLLQFAHIGLLIALAWLLFKRSPALLMIAIAVILNLMLSPFQMENFTWGMQTMFPLVFVAATAAFLCLPLGNLALCIALGIISSLTMPNGILVWPVLVVQAFYLRQSRRVVAALAAVGTAVMVSYLWHYVRPPELGMGAVGMLRHPIDSIMLLGLIVGSPFRFTIPLDVAVGIVTLAVTGYLLLRAQEAKMVFGLTRHYSVFISEFGESGGRPPDSANPARGFERSPAGPLLHHDLPFLGMHRTAGAVHGTESKIPRPVVRFLWNPLRRFDVRQRPAPAY